MITKTPLYGYIEFNPMTATNADIGVYKGWLSNVTTSNILATVSSYDCSPHFIETKLITRQCPNCGAPIGNNKLKCDYCDSCFSEVEA